MTTKLIAVRVDTEVLDKIRILLKDPVRGKTRYGGMSGLVNRLLLNWVIKQLEKQGKQGGESSAQKSPQSRFLGEKHNGEL